MTVSRGWMEIVGLVFLSGAAAAPAEKPAAAKYRLTSAKDVAYAVMQDACATRGVPASFIVIDGKDNTDAGVIKCLRA
jgi:hypothetical protein